jgi:quercetin dioxygenase-like cupin family protein
MELPTPHLRPDRAGQGQRFVFNEGAKAEWTDARLPGFISRDTTIAANTKNVAGVNVIRKGEGTPVWAAHDADIHFTFVMEGTMTLHGEGKDPYPLAAGDAFVTPPAMQTLYADPSDDLELLEVALPGAFITTC